MPVTPRVPNEAGFVGAGAEPQETTLPGKPLAIPLNPNTGLTAELTKPNQNQIGVAVIPQAPQPAPSNLGSGTPSSSGPPVVPVYGPPSSVGMSVCLSSVYLFVLVCPNFHSNYIDFQASIRGGGGVGWGWYWLPEKKNIMG